MRKRSRPRRSCKNKASYVVRGSSDEEEEETSGAEIEEEEIEEEIEEEEDGEIDDEDEEEDEETEEEEEEQQRRRRPSRHLKAIKSQHQSCSSKRGKNASEHKQNAKSHVKEKPVESTSTPSDYEIEDILDSKVVTKNGAARRNCKSTQTLYKVRWKGYSSKYDTWEPLDDIAKTGCVDRYERRKNQLQLEKMHSCSPLRSPVRRRFRSSSRGKKRHPPGVAVIQYQDGETEIVDLQMEKFRTVRGVKGNDTFYSFRDFDAVFEGGTVEIFWKFARMYFEAKVISWSPVDGGDGNGDGGAESENGFKGGSLGDEADGPNLKVNGREARRLSRKRVRRDSDRDCNEEGESSCMKRENSVPSDGLCAVDDSRFGAPRKTMGENFLNVSMDANKFGPKRRDTGTNVAARIESTATEVETEGTTSSEFSGLALKKIAVDSESTDGQRNRTPVTATSFASKEKRRGNSQKVFTDVVAASIAGIPSSSVGVEDSNRKDYLLGESSKVLMKTGSGESSTGHASLDCLDVGGDGNDMCAEVATTSSAFSDLVLDWENPGDDGFQWGTSFDASDEKRGRCAGDNAVLRKVTDTDLTDADSDGVSGRVVDKLGGVDGMTIGKDTKKRVDGRVFDEVVFADNCIARSAPTHRTSSFAEAGTIDVDYELKRPPVAVTDCETTASESRVNVSSPSSIPATQIYHTTMSPPSKRKRNYKHNGEAYIGSRVACHFDNDLFLGTITQYFSREDYFHCRYDDSDEEDFNRDELYEALELYGCKGFKVDNYSKGGRSGGKVTRSKKRASRSSVRVSSVVSKEEQSEHTIKSPLKGKLGGSSSSVGERVAWYFDDELYLGTITQHFKKENYYHCVFDDDDEQDFNEKELQKAMDFYRNEGVKLEMTGTFESEHVQPNGRRKKSRSRMDENVDSAGLVKNSFDVSSNLDNLTLFEVHDITRREIDEVAKLLHQPELKRHADQVAEFFLFCHERQLMWERKKRLRGSQFSSPLSKNITFGTKFFCNIYRELDRGTAYFRYNFIRYWKKRRQQRGYALLEKVLWDALCYRLLNKIETFERFGKIPSREEWPAFQRELNRMHNDNEIIFTAAHQVMGKDRYVQTMTSLWESDGSLIKELTAKINRADNLESVFLLIQENISNVGKFLAWQVVCDLLESSVLPFSEDEYVALGPGARRGITAIFNESKPSMNHAMLLRQIQRDAFAALGLHFPAFLGKDISLKNIEHSLCEFYKFKLGKKGSRMYRPYENWKGSRFHLDMKKCCQMCKQINYSENSKFCDLCFCHFCEECCDSAGLSDSNCVAWWLCPECKD